MEFYDWNQNKSKVSATEILNYQSTGEKVEPPQEYAKSVEQLLNDGENDYNLDKYREQVVKMLGLNVAWQRPLPVDPNVELKTKTEEKEISVELEAAVEKLAKKSKKIKREKRKEKEESEKVKDKIPEKEDEQENIPNETISEEKSQKEESGIDNKSSKREFWFYP